MSFYRWSCRFVRPWFCRELSLREKEARRIFEFSACQQPRWGSMVSRKTSEIVVVYLHLPFLSELAKNCSSSGVPLESGTPSLAERSKAMGELRCGWRMDKAVEHLRVFLP